MISSVFIGRPSMKRRACISAIERGTPQDDPISPQWLMNASFDRVRGEPPRPACAPLGLSGESGLDCDGFGAELVMAESYRRCSEEEAGFQKFLKSAWGAHKKPPRASMARGGEGFSDPRFELTLDRERVTGVRHPGW